MIPRIATFLACLGAPSLADVPSVVADIGPVHSLVARVMDGVGAPVLLVPPSVSPHSYAMRPSEARVLAGAEVIFWVGEDLAPWIGTAVGALGEDAVTVELLEVDGVIRAGEAETSEDDRGDHEGHDHDHDEALEQGGHDHGGHDHGGLDPHVWLDPVNGQIWLAAIAETLGRIDPNNAIIYAANAEAGQAELDSLMLEMQASLAPVRQKGFITFHDAYTAFANRFGVNAIGAISVSDAVPPSAGQVAQLRDAVLASEAVCVFSEPQFDPALVETLVEGTDARSGVLDPLGATLKPGLGLYPALLRGLTGSLAECLSD